MIPYHLQDGGSLAAAGYKKERGLPHGTSYRRGDFLLSVAGLVRRAFLGTFLSYSLHFREHCIWAKAEPIGIVYALFIFFVSFYCILDRSAGDYVPTPSSLYAVTLRTPITYSPIRLKPLTTILIPFFWFFFLFVRTIIPHVYIPEIYTLSFPFAKDTYIVPGLFVDRPDP